MHVELDGKSLDVHVVTPIATPIPVLKRVSIGIAHGPDGLEQKLLGSDTDGQDGFGHSVSVDEDHELLVVGAPYAEDNGVAEVNVLYDINSIPLQRKRVLDCQTPCACM